MKNSKQILKELGIKNIKTLSRWHQQQVIPKPKIEEHPSGRGRIACWDDWVLEHCRVIQRMTSEGHTIASIAKLYGNDWKKVSRRYHTYNFARDTEIQEQAKPIYELAEAINEKVAFCIRKTIDSLIDSRVGVVSDSLAEEALSQFRKGFSPVLVSSSNNDIAVVPDFTISQWLAHHSELGHSIVVLPLAGLLNTLEIKREPKTAAFIGSDVVTERKHNRTTEHVVQVDIDWRFQLTKFSKSKKPKR